MPSLHSKIKFVSALACNIPCGYKNKINQIHLLTQKANLNDNIM